MMKTVGSRLQNMLWIFIIVIFGSVVMTGGVVSIATFHG
jgi:hypothetical protein